MVIGQNIYDTLRTVKMTAVPNLSSSQITIQWEDDPENNVYQLYKKMPQDTSWGVPLITTGDQDTSYLDTDVEVGHLYEYRIIKQTENRAKDGYAYLFSGIDYMPPQKKGDILLLIDSVAADSVVTSLYAYKDILASEGWIPWIVEVSTDETVQAIKTKILQYHSTVDSLTALVLLGNIAVPHSGNIIPDGHTDHKGAWPADLYYGDLDGIWTDDSINNVSSAYPRLHNVPGDGNFDQDEIASDIELAVGRIDCSELPIYEENEYELLDNYLQKNIAFRTGSYKVKRKALFKNLNPWREGLGQSAIRNFVPLVSNDSLVYDNIFDAFYDSFLWSYGGSSGSMYASNGLGTIDTYSVNNFQAIFTAFFGSYYGDYDFENNLLRTILASGKVLSTAWVGAPNWYFHPMGMGLDLGYCTKLTQNNVDEYYAGYFPRYISINLLGDPTLKAFTVLPPHNLKGVQNGNQLRLTWSPSEDDILGYQVYKKFSDTEYFEPLHTEPILDTVWVDSCVQGAARVQYLVKAVKREITPSGSYINHSTGPMYTMITNPSIEPVADFTLSWNEDHLVGDNLSTGATQYQWLLSNDTTITSTNFDIQLVRNREIEVMLIASNECFSDSLQQFLVVSNVADLNLQQTVEIFPNPAQDFLTLNITTAADALQVYDMSGREWISRANLSVGSHQISIEELPVGNYVLKVQIGEDVVSKMFSVKNK